MAHSTSIVSLEVLFSPAEFLALRQRDLTQTVCVVFDVLRATSTMMTALANGAARIIPVAEIEEALAFRNDPGVLLAGERDGLRIVAHQAGGVDFHLGNSPREFTPAAVRDKTIVITTTNGTRALRACAGAKAIMIGSFLGLGALTEWIRQIRPPHLLIVCAGTIDQTSYEDTLAAGALSETVWSIYESGAIADSAVISRQVYQGVARDLVASMRFARNGRRLLANPDLKDDVPFCLRENALQFLASMSAQGEVRKGNPLLA